MAQTFVLFSGLPGTGKSTLAGRLARELRWPLLRIDDLAVEVPAEADHRFWDARIALLLAVAETQLSLGLSVVADSVFMNKDRYHAREIARQHGAAFRPVYCYLSDERLWAERLTRRAGELQNPGLATWDRVRTQRQAFAPWKANTALFVDAVRPMEQNYARVLEFATDPQVQLEPIPEVAYTPGNYHQEPHA